MRSSWAACCPPASARRPPARRRSARASPRACPATTVNKMCGSAMRAVMLASDQILAGSARVIVAGGLESMTNAPYLLPKARAGYRMGHQEVLDHMFFDGLQSPWDGQLMGCFAEATSSKLRIHAPGAGRLRRANRRGGRRPRVAGGCFRGRDRAGDRQDAQGRGGHRQGRDALHHRCRRRSRRSSPRSRRTAPSRPRARPSISDGAAAVVLTRESFAAARGLKPLARILGYTSFAREPEWFTLAPVGAIQKLLSAARLAGLGRRSVRDQRGFRGGYDGGDQGSGSRSRQGERERRGVRARTSDRRHRCAHPDHPAACVEGRGKKRGIASLCIGGGEATAIAIELV